MLWVALERLGGHMLHAMFQKTRKEGQGRDHANGIAKVSELKAIHGTRSPAAATARLRTHLIGYPVPVLAGRPGVLDSAFSL